MALNKQKTLIFAGEFSYGYFINRYGLKYISAYDGENEPGIKKMSEIIKFINKNHEKYILSDFPVSKITQTISEQTQTEILIFNSAHNVQDISKSFAEIMSKNYFNITRMLND